MRHRESRWPAGGWPAAVAALAVSTLCGLLAACGPGGDDARDGNAAAATDGGGAAAAAPDTTLQALAPAAPPAVGGSGPAAGPVAGEPAPAGTAYHLSSLRGDDAHPGTAALPWRTLARAQAALDGGLLRPGDALLLERGSEFFGPLRLGAALRGTAAAPVLIGAFGSGAAPRLHGLRRITGWTPLGAGRWAAPCADCRATPALLRLDGVAQALARWPNLDEGDRGYRYFGAAEGRNRITDAGLPATSRWVGGELVVRSIAWVLDRLPIVAQAGGQITTGADASYPLQAGYGYFIQNHPDAIDREGEWAWDAATRRLILQSAVDPNRRRVEVPVLDTVLQVDGAAYAALRDLAIEGATRRGVDLQACSGLRLQRLRIAATGDAALQAGGCSDLVVEQSQLLDSMNVGARLGDCAGCILWRTSVLRSGVFAGMGANGDGAYVGAVFGGVAGRPALALGNLVADSGYLGLDLRGPATVRGNLVQQFNRVKTDGAGIYTWHGSDIAITDNTVLDGAGSTAGTPWLSTASHGIYVDDQSERITVSGNTVGRSGASGIFLHNTRGVTVSGNTVFSPGESGLLLVDDELGSFGLERTVVRGNTVVATGVPMIDIRSTGNPALFATLGTIDGNLYCDPFAPATVRVGLPGGAGDTLTLAGWRSRYQRDLASRDGGGRRSAFTVLGSPGPNRVANGDFASDLGGWFGWPEGTLDARWESGRLDGGSLRLGVAGPAPAVHFDAPLGALAAGQTWWLQFSLQAVSGEAGLDVYLRQGDAPYADLGPRVSLPAATGRREVSLLLDAVRADAGALLIFELQGAGRAVAIDNVRLRPVSAVRRTLAEVARLEVNPQAAQRRFGSGPLPLALPDGTVLPAGTELRLPGYRSVVLLAP